MSVICDEARAHAAECRKKGRTETAVIIDSMADWIDVQFATIVAQKIEMAELRKHVGDRFGRLSSQSHTPRAKKKERV